MGDICTWPSCKCTAKGQCDGLGCRILAPTFTAADLERAWQPIETAPKDGRPIIAWCADGNAAIVEYYVEPDGFCGWIICHTLDGEQMILAVPATHWMPLPPPPADLAQRVKD